MQIFQQLVEAPAANTALHDTVDNILSPQNPHSTRIFDKKYLAPFCLELKLNVDVLTLISRVKQAELRTLLQ